MIVIKSKLERWKGFRQISPDDKDYARVKFAKDKMYAEILYDTEANEVMFPSSEIFPFKE